MGLCGSKKKVVGDGSLSKALRTGRSSAPSVAKPEVPSPDPVGNEGAVANEDEAPAAEEDPEAIPQFGTFEEFFASTDNPTVYEYRIVKKIGAGAMGTVYLVEDVETGEPSAMKVYNWVNLQRTVPDGSGETFSDLLEREFNLMNSIEFPYVLSVDERIDHVKTSSTILRFPFASLGTLSSQLEKKGLEQRDLAIGFYQIAMALRHLHSHDIVHRDVKQDNVLVFQADFFVLSDFSVSQKLDSPDRRFDDTKGTAAFFAPEIVAGESYLPKPADVWAYGVMVYATVFGEFPFRIDVGAKRSYAESVLLVTECLEKEALAFPQLTDEMDPEIVQLLQGCLDKSPETRLNFEQIVESDYFTEGRLLEEKK
jgi:serine/threonine protein kinase